jgi:hypothetical protein
MILSLGNPKCTLVLFFESFECRRVEFHSMCRQSGNTTFCFLCNWPVVFRHYGGVRGPFSSVSWSTQLPSVTPITRTNCMYAHTRSGFCKSGLPVSRLARPMITTTASSSNPYPYPPHSNPTAHQIFHLPLTASQKEVKSRCLHRLRHRHPFDANTHFAASDTLQIMNL